MLLNSLLINIKAIEHTDGLWILIGVVDFFFSSTNLKCGLKEAAILCLILLTKTGYLILLT